VTIPCEIDPDALRQRPCSRTVPYALEGGVEDKPFNGRNRSRSGEVGIASGRRDYWKLRRQGNEGVARSTNNPALRRCCSDRLGRLSLCVVLRFRTRVLSVGPRRKH
jgi:hypothetical protein